MNKFKFKAKSELNIEEMDGFGIPHENGWVTGWYADGYLLGDALEVHEEYIAHEWWCKVDKNTVKSLDNE